MMRAYIQLIKPGYLLSNDLTAIAGFLLASRGHVNLPLLLVTLIAISLGLMSVNIFNNIIDRHLDGTMKRTQKRPLVTGAISPRAALVLALLSGAAATVVFIRYTNLLTLAIGAFGFVMYEGFYSLAKRRTTWSTLIGAIPGAIPPVAGYTAVTGRLDLGALLFFSILLFWQLPHFYAIAIYRLQDYKQAHIPVLPVIQGIPATKLHMLFFVVAFSVSIVALYFTGLTGYIYLAVMGALSLFWISFSCYGFFAKETNWWARKMFVASLVINLTFSVLIAANSYI